MTEAGKLPPPLPPRLDWFLHTQVGPLARCGMPEWFHGTISRETAENLLESQPPGTFLIRVSHSHVGYTLSYKAQGCCRHFMVKLLDDGTFIFAGQDVVHASLDALVIFHQKTPIRPHGELLTQACGQKDPANADYEHLFHYFHTVSEDADGPREAQPSSRPPGETSERKASAAAHGQPASASCAPKAPFWEARQKLWETLKTVPQAGRRAQQRLNLHVAAAVRPRGPVARAASWDGPCHPRDPGAASASPEPPAWKDRDAAPHKTSRPASWRDAASGLRAWRGKVMRALSVQETKPKPGDLASQDLLPEEYLPPPPFAPGY